MSRARRSDALRYLGPAWFTPVMGLAGLGLAWYRAQPLMGVSARLAAWLLGGAAALLFVMVLAASIWRLRRWPQALAEDLRHPVRHAFVATMPVALILLASLGHALGLTPALMLPLWSLGCLGQLGVTVWILQRLLGQRAALPWATLTPVLIIPVVGNVLAPLAGIGLGQTAWATAQFGLGALLWPLILGLLLRRIAKQGLWPERLLATSFITVAPPAVIGLDMQVLGAPVALAWACWGLALCFLIWAGSQLKRMLAQPFALPFWALSFPLAAFASLTVQLAARSGSGALLPLAMLSLALASVVMLGLLVGSYRGLRDGNLLAPEPVASIVPAVS